MASSLIPGPRIAAAIAIIVVLAIGTAYAAFALHLFDLVPHRASNT